MTNNGALFSDDAFKSIQGKFGNVTMLREQVIKPAQAKSVLAIHCVSSYRERSAKAGFLSNCSVVKDGNLMVDSYQELPWYVTSINSSFNLLCRCSKMEKKQLR